MCHSPPPPPLRHTRAHTHRHGGISRPRAPPRGLGAVNSPVGLVTGHPGTAAQSGPAGKAARTVGRRPGEALTQPNPTQPPNCPPPPRVLTYSCGGGCMRTVGSRPPGPAPPSARRQTRAKCAKRNYLGKVTAFPLAEQRWTRAIHRQTPGTWREPPCPRPTALAPSITAWRVAYRELAEDLLSIAKQRQRGCPACSGPFVLGRPHHASTPRQGARPQGLEGVEISEA